MQPITKDSLVAHERVLGASLLVVAGLLLPLTSTNFANASHRAISGSTSATSDLRGLDRWHHDLRVPTRSWIVQRTAIVGAANNLADLAWRAIHKINAHAGVIYARICQSLADDYAIAVDTEMQLLPTTNALSSVFDGSPLALAEDRKAAAVDHQIDPAELLRHP
ncbi:MAG: hypothetical protein ACJAQZ_002802 [Planctomycetota bacterium]|jgi:hypothetical protein